MSIHQCKRVLDHMIDHGYITPLIAQSYGIQRLAARIKDLRAQGVRIDNEIRVNDAGVRYSKYTLLDRGHELFRRRLGYDWQTTRPGTARPVKTYTGGRPNPVLDYLC